MKVPALDCLATGESAFWRLLTRDFEFFVSTFSDFAALRFRQLTGCGRDNFVRFDFEVSAVCDFDVEIASAFCCDTFLARDDSSSLLDDTSWLKTFSSE